MARNRKAVNKKEYENKGFFNWTMRSKSGRVLRSRGFSICTIIDPTDEQDIKDNAATETMLEVARRNGGRITLEGWINEPGQTSIEELTADDF